MASRVSPTRRTFHTGEVLFSMTGSFARMTGARLHQPDGFSVLANQRVRGPRQPRAAPRYTTVLHLLRHDKRLPVLPPEHGVGLLVACAGVTLGIEVQGAAQAIRDVSQVHQGGRNG